MWTVGSNLLCIVSALNMVAALDADNHNECKHTTVGNKQVIYTYLGEPTHVMKRRSIEQRLRIFIYYDPVSIPALPQSRQRRIKDVIIPDAVHYFQDTLRVRTSDMRIRLFRRCVDYVAVYFRGGYRPYCQRGCEETTLCGSVKVPAEHLSACYMLIRGNPMRLDVDGQGVDSDFVLYVSAHNTTACSGNTVAHANHCQLERSMDRPVAGNINICPGQFEENAHSVHLEIATIKHEIFHILGFSASLFGFFRDKHGEPTTPRHVITGLPPVVDGVMTWSMNVTRNFTRYDWRVRSGSIRRQVYMIVTPTVVNEGMTGTITQHPVFSRVTLALMEDTGWYNVNYRQAEKLLWGFGLGCMFAKSSCLHYMQNRTAAGKTIAPYCDVRDYTNMSCSQERKAINVCNLVRYPQLLDTKYQNFDTLSGVAPSDVGFYGGSTGVADYCPFLDTFLRTTRRGFVGSQCWVSENKPEPEKNVHMETYGPQSFCVAHYRAWVIRSGELRQVPSFGGGGCYKISCSGAEDTGFSVQVGDDTVMCLVAGQVVDIDIATLQYRIEANVICPPYLDVCMPSKAPTFPDDTTWDSPEVSSCGDTECKSGDKCRQCNCTEDKQGQLCDTNSTIRANQGMTSPKTKTIPFKGDRQSGGMTIDSIEGVPDTTETENITTPATTVAHITKTGTERPASKPMPFTVESGQSVTTRDSSPGVPDVTGTVHVTTTATIESDGKNQLEKVGKSPVLIILSAVFIPIVLLSIGAFFWFRRRKKIRRRRQRRLELRRSARKQKGRAIRRSRGRIDMNHPDRPHSATDSLPDQTMVDATLGPPNDNHMFAASNAEVDVETPSQWWGGISMPKFSTTSYM